MGKVAAAEAGGIPLPPGRPGRPGKPERPRKPADLPGSDGPGGGEAAGIPEPGAGTIPVPDRDLLPLQRRFPLGGRGDPALLLPGQGEPDPAIHRGRGAQQRSAGAGMLPARAAGGEYRRAAGREYPGDRKKQGVPENRLRAAGHPVQPAGGPGKAAEAADGPDHRRDLRGGRRGDRLPDLEQRGNQKREFRSDLRHLRRGDALPAAERHHAAGGAGLPAGLRRRGQRAGDGAAGGLPEERMGNGGGSGGGLRLVPEGRGGG